MGFDSFKDSKIFEVLLIIIVGVIGFFVSSYIKNIEDTGSKNNESILLLRSQQGTNTKDIGYLFKGQDSILKEFRNFKDDTTTKLKDNEINIRYIKEGVDKTNAKLDKLIDKQLNK